MEKRENRILNTHFEMQFIPRSTVNPQGYKINELTTASAHRPHKIPIKWFLFVYIIVVFI